MGVRSPMTKTRPKLGNEIKWGDLSNVCNTVDNQGIKGILKYCAKGPIRISSPMSKNRSKKDIEKKWGDRYNVFKTIEKKDTEKNVVHGANGKMTIVK